METPQSYEYFKLPSASALRIAELLPGRGDEVITCRLHVVDWESKPNFEAISYAWGDLTDRVTVVCDTREVQVSKNLTIALSHYRYEGKSRFVWADALCINQEDLLERSQQVKQMKRIYENAQKVQIWIGSDTESNKAYTAINAIRLISGFLCNQLEIETDGPATIDTYQELLLKKKDRVPWPGAVPSVTKSMWESLVWFYSHPYFTRIWVIQEVGANVVREVSVGNENTTWNKVDLVASFIIMDSSFSNAYGFSTANCWWVATITEMIARSSTWLNTLYLASNYSCYDPRDIIYGLRGLMKLDKGGKHLEPDYSRTLLEVYRDSVKAALINFKKVDVLCYVSGKEELSWVPRWDVPMLFRNPFRFGKPMPWRPAGETDARWSINESTNTLTLWGYFADTISYAESYNQAYFADRMTKSVDARTKLKKVWTRIFKTISAGVPHHSPLEDSFVAAIAVALSFGLGHTLNQSEELTLLYEYMGYLKLVFADDESILQTYFSSGLLRDYQNADGFAFGKPVWDFDYPDSSIFVTKDQRVGCATVATQPGDKVFISMGSTYPFILRAHNSSKPLSYAIRGFSYIHGLMFAENPLPEFSEVHIT